MPPISTFGRLGEVSQNRNISYISFSIFCFDRPCFAKDFLDSQPIEIDVATHSKLFLFQISFTLLSFVFFDFSLAQIFLTPKHFSFRHQNVTTFFFFGHQILLFEHQKCLKAVPSITPNNSFFETNIYSF